MKTFVPALSVAVGLILLVISFIWPRMFPANRYWNDEHEDRLEHVNQYVHENLYRVRQAQQSGKQLDPQFLDEYQRATGEGERLRRQSESARNRPQRIAALWRWAGVVVMAAGIVASYVCRQNS